MPLNTKLRFQSFFFIKSMAGEVSKAVGDAARKATSQALYLSGETQSAGSFLSLCLLSAFGVSNFIFLAEAIQDSFKLYQIGAAYTQVD